MENDDINEETYGTEMNDIYVETFVSVEAYAATIKYVKAMVYVMGTLSKLPTASATHADLNHEHGRDEIQNFAILASVSLSLLTLGYWLGSRNERFRQR